MRNTSSSDSANVEMLKTPEVLKCTLGKHSCSSQGRCNSSKQQRSAGDSVVAVQLSPALLLLAIQLLTAAYNRPMVTHEIRIFKRGIHKAKNAITALELPLPWQHFAAAAYVR
jgi:hypothetical protein